MACACGPGSQGTGIEATHFIQNLERQCLLIDIFSFSENKIIKNEFIRNFRNLTTALMTPRHVHSNALSSCSYFG